MCADDSERIHILRIRSDASGALIWFDRQGGEIREPQFKTSYIDVIAAQSQIMEDAKSQLHNAVENLGSIRNAKG